MNSYPNVQSRVQDHSAIQAPLWLSNIKFTNCCDLDPTWLNELTRITNYIVPTYLGHTYFDMHWCTNYLNVFQNPLLLDLGAVTITTNFPISWLENLKQSDCV